MLPFRLSCASNFEVEVLFRRPLKNDSSIYQSSFHIPAPAKRADHVYKYGDTASSEDEELITVNRQGKAIPDARGRTAQLESQQCGVHEQRMAEHESHERQYPTRFCDVGND